MSQYFSEEEESFRKEVKDFLKNEIEPSVDEIEKGASIAPEIYSKIGKRGYIGLFFPKSVGGLEKGLRHTLVFVDELAYLTPSITALISTTMFSAIPIFNFGTKEQIATHGKKIINGDKLGCIGITEPNAGSDAIGGMEATAKKDGDNFIINGEKRFITNGGQADFVILFAITDTSKPKHQGISAFIVDTSTSGFEVVKNYELMGLKGVKNSHLKFSDVVVDKSCLIGHENRGVHLLLNELNIERTILAQESVANARAAFDIAIKYSNERKQFGKKIRKFEAINFKMAEMATDIHAAQLMTLHAAALIDAKKSADMEAAMAKLYAARVGFEVSDDCLQILGGMGYTSEYRIEMLFRSSRISSIGGGTSEIMKFLIQRELYKKYGL